jgi:uncharacterized protein YndB with AHSA1/START domain
MKITISITINSDIKTVWDAWTNPLHITKWNFASDDWHCPSATNTLKPGGTFSYRMEAKDGSMSFDFEGSYDEVILHERITFSLVDDRIVEVEFSTDGSLTTVSETFEAEDDHTAEQQRAGWLAILVNFKKHVESI